MHAFLRHINTTYQVSLSSYWDLHRWSLANLREFWRQVWLWCGLCKHLRTPLGQRPEDATVLEDFGAMDDFPLWFPEATLNAAEALLFPEANPDPLSIAVRFRSELPSLRRDLTWTELRASVKTLQSVLISLGVGSGDRIAACTPNSHHALIFMLAGASLGAIFTAGSPDFGASALIDRFGQTEPKVLLACDAVWYNGRWHEQNDKLKTILKACPSLSTTIRFCFRDSDSDENASQLPGTVLSWETLFQGHSKAVQRSEIHFEPLPFSHPLYILYSSGTTGRPKCIVHSAGGTLLQHAKEHCLHGNVLAGDCVLQYTTVGWMMWQWLVSCLSQGAAIVLYDGSPLRPDEGVLWRIVEEEAVTHLGVSAKYLQHLQQHTGFNVNKDGLKRLRCIWSTGSPLPPSAFRFLYEGLLAGGNVQVASITGGTDIVSLFAGGCLMLPVHAGEIQASCLGMAVAAVDADGDGHEALPGETGDLVCTLPFPSMPVGFWRKPAEIGSDSLRYCLDVDAYRAAYFPSDRLPAHVWHHGDFCRFNAHTRGLELLGRSDGTLNPAGVRFGSAELYNVVLDSDAPWKDTVKDALVVGVQCGASDEQVFLFLERSTESDCDFDALSASIRAAIRSRLSPRHVPARILIAPSIPYTINGKKMEVPVKRILNGAPDLPVPLSIANPESLDFFRDLARSLANK